MLKRKTQTDPILAHYEREWHSVANLRHWPAGPVEELPKGFLVAELPPRRHRTVWTYATSGMSGCRQERPLEVFLHSLVESDRHVELLSATCHYHCTSEPLWFGHTVNFGRPWLEGSLCEYGLVSRPYLESDRFDEIPGGKAAIRFGWLLPITEAERSFKIAHGLEDLEELFEKAQVDYLNPHRQSVV